MGERIDRRNAHFPGRAPIDAYGNGGFRFADMSHRGSILCLPSGIYAWSVATAEELDAAAFAPVFAEKAQLGLLLLGTGPRPRPGDARARAAPRLHGREYRAGSDGHGRGRPHI